MSPRDAALALGLVVPVWLFVGGVLIHVLKRGDR